MNNDVTRHRCRGGLGATGAGRTGEMPANCAKAAGLIVTCAAAKAGNKANVTIRADKNFTRKP